MNKYAEIIPIIKLPKSLGIFDYAVPGKMQGEIRVGQVVKAPFRRKEVLGVVFKLKDKSEIFQGSVGEDTNRQPRQLAGRDIRPTVKEIIEIVLSEPYATALQLKILPWLANYYFQSPALFLKTMLPKILRRPRKVELQKEQLQLINISKQEGLGYEKIKNSKKNVLILGKPNADLYAKLALEQLQKNKATMILLPEIMMTDRLVFRFKEVLGTKNLAVFHSGVSDSEYYSAWRRVLGGEAKVIVGTRLAVFAPVKNLGLIIIDSEHDLSFKSWDMNPRYCAQTVAFRIAEETGARIIAGSLTPRVTTYFKAKEESWQILNFIGEKKNFEIVDIKDEYKRGNFSIISERLQKEIKSGRQGILFINRKGSASFVICRDCGYVPKCDCCGLPYSQGSEGRNDLFCEQCCTFKTLDNCCPRCGGARFKPVGFGTQKVEAELKKLFPSIAVGRIDSDVAEEEIFEVVNNFREGKINIIVATQAIFSLLFGDYQTPPTPHLSKGGKYGADFTAMVSADTSLQIPDYTAAEKAWQIILELAELAKNKILIQGWNLESPIFKFAAARDFKKFYEYELGARKDFSYLPFGSFIKLICQNRNKKAARGEALGLAGDLKSAIQKYDWPVKLFGPVAARGVILRGQFRYHLILKFKERGDWLNKLMELAPDNWIVDVEPEELG